MDFSKINELSEDEVLTIYEEVLGTHSENSELLGGANWCLCYVRCNGGGGYARGYLYSCGSYNPSSFSSCGRYSSQGATIIYCDSPVPSP